MARRNIYRINLHSDVPPLLVRAKSRAQARAASVRSVTLASQEDIVELLGAGMKVLDAQAVLEGAETIEVTQ